MKVTRAMIDSGVVVERAVHQFYADASDLGVPPGPYPQSLSTNLGNGQPFVLQRYVPGAGLYKQSMGCITLHMFND